MPLVPLCPHVTVQSRCLQNLDSNESISENMGQVFRTLMQREMGSSRANLIGSFVRATNCTAPAQFVSCVPTEQLTNR